jgi:hypothetical protein
MFEMENRCIPYDYEPPRESKRPRQYPPITPELHQEIKRLYQRKKNNSGEVRDFARKHGLPRWKISQYAVVNGFIPKSKKEPNWSPQELSILERNAMHCTEVIQRNLKKHGFSRSLGGITLKRKRLRLISNLEGQSSRSAAMCLGEDDHFITDMIRKGYLKASRREQKRTPQQGGNYWYIKDKDLKNFIINYPEFIDLRKVDKFWFISLLAE